MPDQRHSDGASAENDKGYIECPACHELFDPSEMDLVFSVFDQSKPTLECGHCDTVFTVDKQVTTVYTTTELPNTALWFLRANDAFDEETGDALWWCRLDEDDGGGEGFSRYSEDNDCRRVFTSKERVNFDTSDLDYVPDWRVKL